jgi:hypothetical protein
VYWRQLARFFSVLVLGLAVVPSAVANPAGGCPAARSSMGMAYDAARHQVVVFGGLNVTGALKDMWSWNGTQWSQVNAQPVPRKRFKVGMTYDAARQETLMFGGVAVPQDTWLWDGMKWLRDRVQPSPGRRSGMGLVYDGTRHEVVLFGGGRDPSGEDLGDTWTWDGQTWTMKSPLVSPPSRDDAAGMAYDGARQETLLFGGSGEGGARDDTWTWDGQTWTEQHPAVSPPAGSPSLAFDAATQQIVAFGGDGTWTWDGTIWAEEFPPVAPPPRADAGMVNDAAHREIVLFGGISLENEQWLKDVWTWDGSSWTQKALSCS